MSSSEGGLNTQTVTEYDIITVEMLLVNYQVKPTRELCQAS